MLKILIHDPIFYRLNRRLPKKILRHIQGVVGLRSDDVILASYPKSGNTWIRFFFCNLISLSELNGKIVDFKFLDETMPEFGFSNLIVPWPYSRVPRLVKSHKSSLPIFAKKTVIHVVRDPRDVMVSRYFMHRGKKRHFNLTFSEFIRHARLGLPTWFRYHQSWNSVMKHIFKYEEMRANDVREFKRMIELLNLDISEALFQEALRRSSFKYVRMIEKELGHSKPNENRQEYTFTRKGITGDWQNYFSNDDIEYVHELINRYPDIGFLSDYDL